MEKKLVILISSFILLLSSCSFYQAPNDREPAAAKSCNDLMKSFFSTPSFSKKLNIDASDDDLAKFAKFFTNIDFDRISESDADMLRSIYLFSNGDVKVREQLAIQFNSILKGETADSKNKEWSRFLKHKTKVETAQKKIIKKNLTSEGLEKARAKSLIYEKLYYSCRAQTQKAPSSAEIKQAKYLTYALTAGASASAASTYSVIHWEEEKDSKWMKGLYFEVGLNAVFSYIGGKYVTTNPKLNPWTARAPLTYLNAAGADAGTSAVYAYFFNATDAEMEKKLEELKKDPQVREELSEILYYAQENKLFEKHQKATEQLFASKKGKGPMTAEEIKILLDSDKIDLEESRELLFEAMADKQYEEEAGPLSVGSVATDRYAFHRIWGLASVPANISLALIMQKQMCMATNPKAGFAKAVSTFFAGSLLLDAIYFKTRQEVINQ